MFVHHDDFGGKSCAGVNIRSFFKQIGNAMLFAFFISAGTHCTFIPIHGLSCININCCLSNFDLQQWQSLGRQFGCLSMCFLVQQVSSKNCSNYLMLLCASQHSIVLFSFSLSAPLQTLSLSILPRLFLWLVGEMTPFLLALVLVNGLFVSSFALTTSNASTMYSLHKANPPFFTQSFLFGHANNGVMLLPPILMFCSVELVLNKSTSK